MAGRSGHRERSASGERRTGTAVQAVAASHVYAGLFMTTSSVLALEILLTRILSVVTWYSLAFLVITLGLFGLTVGALRVYLEPDRYAPGALRRSLASDATAAAILIPVTYVLILIVPLSFMPVWTVLPLYLVFCVILALPFVPAGSVVAASLTRAGLPVGRVYAVDLAGAALGALFLPLILPITNAGTGALLLGALSGGAAIAFADRGAARRRAAVLVGALLVLGGAQALVMNGLEPLWVKGKLEDRGDLALETWNSYSRVQVSDDHVAAAVLWAPSPSCVPLPSVRQRRIEIDGDAGTMLFDAGGDPRSMSFLLCDVTSLVHRLRSNGRVAVLGVGGSKDIQAALSAAHREVVGLELNRAIVDVLRGPMGVITGLSGNPSVRLVNDEARSWLAGNPGRFDVIQAALTDTWAATGAGAHALGENGLYTLDAWRLFLDRLEPGGIFTVSRWHTDQQPAEGLRLTSLAVAALLDRGVESPADRLALVGSGRIATILVGRDAFTAQDLSRLNEAAQSLQFRILFAPNTPARDPILARILASRSPSALAEAAVTPRVDLRPPTDDRPYFFNVIRLAGILQPDIKNAGANDGNRLATRALVLTVLAALSLAFFAILVPLRRRAALSRPGRPGLAAALAYFTLIGIGFLFAEIALLQRLSLILGHPTWSLLVVLPGLVGATGIGSWLSDRIRVERAPVALVIPLLIMFALVLTAFLIPATAAAVSTMPLGARIGTALGFTGFCGLALGLAFPAGMRLAIQRGLERETPWFWGLNGVGSVVGGGLALLIAHEVGIQALMLAGALAYAGLVPAIRSLTRGRAAGTAP